MDNRKRTITNSANALVKRLKIIIQNIIKTLKNNLLIVIPFTSLSLIIAYFYFKKACPSNRLIFPKNIGFLTLIKKNRELIKYYNKNYNKSKKSGKLPQKLYKYPSGVTNYGNNCYINVIFQCISSLDEFDLFSKEIISKSKSGNEVKDNSLTLIEDFNNTIEDINGNEDSFISPSKTIDIINENFSFAYEQQDSYELFHRIQDLYEEKAKLYNMSSPFSIEWQIIYECKTCKNDFHKKETTSDITVIPDLKNNKVQEKSDIEDYQCTFCTIKFFIAQLQEQLLNKSLEITLLEEFKIIKDYLEDLLVCIKKKSKEIPSDVVKDLEKFCEESKLKEQKVQDFITYVYKCKKLKSSLSKTSKINQYPKILCVHIQKVYMDSDLNVITGRQQISCYENFDIEELINGIKVKSTYELVSFIEHFGTANYGHYISYRKFYGKWLNINDSKVKLMETIDALNVANPYMCFYRKLEREK